MNADDTVLLIIDVQNLLMENKPYNKKEFISNIKQLMIWAKQKEIEIIYVRHDDGEGSDLARNSFNWQIYKEIAPVSNEKIVDKIYNSAFKDTDLKNYLQKKQIKNLIITGMQTEYCIDATIKSAFDNNYDIILPHHCTTTFDNDFLPADRLLQYYEEKIWHNRFAKVCEVADIIKNNLNKNKMSH